MCKTTQRKNSANPGTQNPAGPKPPALPPIKTLQQYLTAAYTAERANLEPSSMVINGFTLKSKDAAISIDMIGSGSQHEYAEINGKVMDYSGSLVKVGAVYAAHDLRAAARKHATDNSFSSNAAFASSFLSVIDTSKAVKSLITFGKGLKPVVNEIFTGFKPAAPNKVEFAPALQAALDDFGENASAGKVIRALGYSYINASLINGGFYNPTSQKGIWLAGDYSAELITKSVRVPVDNDTVPDGSGQAITTEQMTRMYRLVHTGGAFTHVADAAERAAANSDMHTLLQHKGSFFFGANSTVQISETPLFARDCAKVGIGTLGPLVNGKSTGPEVISEGSVMRWNATADVTAFNSAHGRSLSGDFAFVWQNTYHPNAHWDALIRIVNTTIKNFLAQA